MDSTRLLLFTAGVAASFMASGSARAAIIDVTAPGNPIVGVAATLGSATSTLATAGGGSGNAFPTAEAPPNAIDNNTSDKYLNFQQSGAGFIVTPSAASIVNAFRFATGNDAVERDPLMITIEGTNSLNATTTLNSTWTTIYSGVSGLATDPGRDTFGATVSFSNATSFLSYRVLVSSVRTPASANSFQFSEIELGSDGSSVPEPSSIVLSGLGCVFGTLLVVRRRGRFAKPD
jgi:hypothetical protein